MRSSRRRDQVLRSQPRVMDQLRIEAPRRLLVVSDGEWAGRSLESVLESRDYVVNRLTRGREALVAARAQVDAIIVEEQLEDMAAPEFCRLVRREAAGAGIPIVVIASRGISPRRRVEMYAASAWDYCSQPLDLDVLLLKLDTFIRARRELSEAADRFVDPALDLYTLRGFRRWSRELSARAARGHEPLACLVLTPVANETSSRAKAIDTSEPWVARAAHFVASQRRESDVAAYVGGGTFAILAPGTGPEGAEQFSERLRRASQELSPPDQTHRELQVGFAAVHDFATADVDAEELFRRASTALSHLRRSGRRSAVLRFDDLAM